MQLDISLVKTIAKQGFKTLALILILTISGVIANWILLAFLIPELGVLFDASAARGAHGGGPAVILALLLLVAMNWQASLLFLIFFLVFPIFHFLFAKKYAVTKAIHALLSDRKTQFVEYLLQKFFEKISSKTEWLDKLNSSGPIQVINEYLPLYLKKLDGMPFIVRIIAKFFLGRLDFMGIVSSTINESGQIDISQDEIIRKISLKVNGVIDEKLFSPSFSLNWILYGVNISFFILVKVIV
jgi:hypothetical protein